MKVTIDLTEETVLTVFRGVLLGVLPDLEIIKTQVNRVPEPQGLDFVLMTPMLRKRLSTNIDTYDRVNGTKNILMPTQLTVQLTVHGPNSADNAHMLSAVLRDEYTTHQFDQTDDRIQTLYADDPKQIPFVNGEDQWETRWVVDAQLEIKPTVRVFQDFAEVLVVTLFEVDKTEPAFGLNMRLENGRGRWLFADGTAIGWG